jgi:starvation-inducible DNA-binding protein
MAFLSNVPKLWLLVLFSSIQDLPLMCHGTHVVRSHARLFRRRVFRNSDILTADAGWILAGLGSMAKRQLDAGAILDRAKPLLHQQAHEIHPYGHLVTLPIALAENVCKDSVENLNQLLADTMTLRDLYKKHHWQAAGPTFYQLHLLFDKHFDQQSELVDAIAERIQLLGGVSLAMAPDIAETTLIPRPPKGREEVPVQVSRLLHAHEIVLEEARAMARRAAEGGDDGTNDLLVSSVIRTNELQVWFVAEHVVDVPLVHAD